MITDEDRETLRKAEQSARDRLDKQISLEWLKAIGFEDSGDGPVKVCSGVRITIGRTADESTIYVYLWRSEWPKPVKTRTQLLAIIAALEAE
jgi:hypothetical protein